MTVVDSSVWIALLRDQRTRQVVWLEATDPDDILVADLVLAEVLQGARDDAHALRLRVRMAEHPIVDVLGEAMALETARQFRKLRALGISLRRQVDLMLGAFCILHDHDLLHGDRDFDPMVRHLGLRLAPGSAPLH